MRHVAQSKQARQKAKPKPHTRETESLTKQEIQALNHALDKLNASLDRFIAALKASADDYKAAADRLARTG